MPAYEFSVLLKSLPRQEVSLALKRIGSLLLDKGAFLQKIDNHGTRELPYRMTKEGQPLTQGSYFVYSFIGSPKLFKEVDDACKLDVDIIKHGFVPVYKDLAQDCTLEEELLPPALRPSVLNLMANSKKIKGKTKYTHRYHIDYDYFHIHM